MAKNRAARRHKWRLSCEVVSAGRSQRAIVLDISESGLFVQTGTRLPPGAEVEVRVRLMTNEEPVALRARVARNKQVPPQLTSIARGGVGLRILDAPRAYYDQIQALENTEAANAPTAADAPKPATGRFRVRVKQSGGQRSRCLEIVADSIEDARSRALAELGSGWEAVTTEAIGAG